MRCRGRDTAQVGSLPEISSSTVEVYRANAMSKLGGCSLSDTVRTAFAAAMGRANNNPSVRAGDAERSREVPLDE